MGSETLIVLALALNDGLLTPALALVCWPVAGLAGRFPDRASRLGTLFAVMLAGAAVLATDPGILTRDPLALSLLLVAFVAITPSPRCCATRTSSIAARPSSIR